MRNESSYSVLLDTSFLIRLLSAKDSLHSNALGYFKYFLNHHIPMYLSTITVAEYCVNGDIAELPLRNVRILPFNFQHASVAGKFAKVLFEARSANEIFVENRLLIPNDAKILAQANCVESVKYFVTSDTKSSNLINRISNKEKITFAHMDIHTPYTEQFGILDI